MITPGDRVIVDKGTANEFEAIVYMTANTLGAICNLDGDREIINLSRLTLK